MPRAPLLIAAAGLAVSAFAVAWLLCPAPKETEMTPPIELMSFDDVSPEMWKGLQEKRIFFGHQSVGRNVIDGIEDVMSDHPEVSLKIVETSQPGSIQGPVFCHSRVGENVDPISKIDDFVGILSTEGAQKIDIAFLKLCYVDIQDDATAERAFRHYAERMAALRERLPGTTFLHVSVPIESIPVSISGRIKESIKRCIRRPGVIVKNRARLSFGNLLRRTYADEEPIFDIAHYEAVDPEGLALAFSRGDMEPVMVMQQAYTDDGGHLNPVGRRIVAEQLLISLARIAADQDCR